MACFQSVRITYTRDGGDPQEQYVPCGKCLGCRKEQGRQWAVRLCHEAQFHESAIYATLTYEDASLPEYGSLDKESALRFVRRCRDYCKPDPFSYYIVGEYGDESDRPHYHVLAYGLPVRDRYHFRGSGAKSVWKSDTLDGLWGRGHTEFSAITMGSASYVAGYVRKKLLYHHNPSYWERYVPETGEVVSVEPEFGLMSRRPAIGRRYIEKFWRSVYAVDEVRINGVSSRPPRYYDKWLQEHQPDKWRQVKAARLARELDSESSRQKDLRDRLRYEEHAMRKRAEDKLQLRARRIL